MPFVERPQAAGPFGVDAGRPKLNPPSFGEVADAALFRTNSVASAWFAQYGEEPFLHQRYDPEFDPYDAAKGTPLEGRPELLKTLRNRGHFDWQLSRLEMERTWDRTLHEGGGVGVAASLGMGLVDPINLIPLPGIGPGAGIFRTAIRGGAALAAGNALSEAVLHETQLDYDPLAGLLSVGGGALLGSLLGGSYAAVTRGARFGVTPEVAAAGGAARAAAAEAGEAAGLARGLENLGRDPTAEEFAAIQRAAEGQALRPDLDASDLSRLFEEQLGRDLRQESWPAGRSADPDVQHPPGGIGAQLILERPQPAETVIAYRTAATAQEAVEAQPWGLVAQLDVPVRRKPISAAAEGRIWGVDLRLGAEERLRLWDPGGTLPGTRQRSALEEAQIERRIVERARDLSATEADARIARALAEREVLEEFGYIGAVRRVDTGEVVTREVTLFSTDKVSATRKSVEFLESEGHLGFVEAVDRALGLCRHT